MKPTTHPNNHHHHYQGLEQFIIYIFIKVMLCKNNNLTYKPPSNKIKIFQKIYISESNNYRS